MTKVLYILLSILSNAEVSEVKNEGISVPPANPILLQEP